MARRPKPFDEAQHESISDIPNLQGLSDEEIIDAIKSWVLENFEDPVHDTPHDSSEGGYQYIWGGPYETRDIVETMFGDAVSEAIINEAISELEDETSEWVPNGNRRVPPDDEEFDGEVSGNAVEEAYDRVLDEVKSLEALLAQLPEFKPGIGHNLPPEPISEVSPLTPADDQQLVAALETLKTQTATPADGGAAATAAMAVIESKRKTLLAWLLKQGDAFVSEAVREGGKELGKWGMRAIIAAAAAHMSGLDQAVTNWLSKLL